MFLADPKLAASERQPWPLSPTFPWVVSRVLGCISPGRSTLGSFLSDTQLVLDTLEWDGIESCLTRILKFNKRREFTVYATGGRENGCLLFLFNRLGVRPD